MSIHNTNTPHYADEFTEFPVELWAIRLLIVKVVK
jgi:hypothetical protein